MAQNNWEADKMLDVYIHDYLMKRNLQTTARTFMSEGKVSTEPVAIDAPGGFLFEWWSVFWDIFISRTNDKHSQAAATYIQAQQMKAREQHMQMQQLQQRRGQLQRRDANHPSINGPLNPVNPEALLGPSPASLLAAKMYGEHLKHPQSMDSEASSQLLDPSKAALFNSSASRQGQLGQNNSGSLPTTLQHMQGRNQPAIEIKSELGVPQRSLPMDPSTGQSILQAKSGIGLNQGVNGLPLKGWPLTGIDQLRPGLGPQLQKPIVSNQNQFQLLSPSQQQILVQAQAQSNFGNLAIHGDMDPRRLRASSRSALSGKDGQMNGNDGSIGSPIKASPPQVPQIQHMSNQQGQEQLQQQQSFQIQNSRKRKPTSSGAANSTGTGHTVGPSVNSPSSTHTPGDGVQLTGNLQGVSTTSKSLMMYGTDAAGGLASSSNHMDDIHHFADVGSLDDNVESFLSNDDGDGRDIFAELKRSPIEQSTESMRGFTFTEVGCIRTSTSKVASCHFSSDGKLLASAGHERKVVLWNMENLQTESSSQGHSLIITDVCFRPNSTQLVTSSFDRTIHLWDAAESIKSLHTFNGHSSQVTSVDFHPIKTDIFSSCDGNGEIRYWSISQNSCSRVLKGGSVQVRFQPRNGQFLASAADNMVSIIDFETNTPTRSLQVLPEGYNKEILSICWDATGECLASTSQDCVKIWSLKSGEPIHELRSNGNKFHSCTFHPRYPQLLVIGGYQSLELWNIAENRTMTVQAHEGLIAALAQSTSTGMVASASHDKSVKIWK